MPGCSCVLCKFGQTVHRTEAQQCAEFVYVVDRADLHKNPTHFFAQRSFCPYHQIIRLLTAGIAARGTPPHKADGMPMPYRSASRKINKGSFRRMDGKSGNAFFVFRAGAELRYKHFASAVA